MSQAWLPWMRRQASCAGLPVHAARQSTAGIRTTLATAGGLVFGGTTEGYVFALDARTGKPLWRFPAGGPVFANPVRYLSGVKQHVAVAAGSALFVFAVE